MASLSFLKVSHLTCIEFHFIWVILRFLGLSVKKTAFIAPIFNLKVKKGRDEKRGGEMGKKEEMAGE